MTPQTPANTHRLKSAEIEIWTVGLDQPADVVDELRASLPPDEQARADRFHFPRDRRRFCVAHAALRDILGRLLGQPPAEVALASGTYGKPALEPGRSSIEFNLSHAGEYALVALTLGAAVGIDIEQIRAINDIRRLAAHTFSPAELARLERCPPELYDQAFFNCWTRKEAVIKALGLGLHCPLDSFDVACLPGEPARILRGPPGGGQWSLAELAAPEGYAAAVVVAGPPRPIVRREWAG